MAQTIKANHNNVLDKHASYFELAIRYVTR